MPVEYRTSSARTRTRIDAGERDAIATAVRAHINAAPPLTTEAVRRLSELLGVELHLPGDFDAGRVEARATRSLEDTDLG